MEIFVDFGLFELIGVVVVALMSRDPRVRHQMRVALTRVISELGQCRACMTATAVGLGAAWWAYLSLGVHASRLLRWPLVAAAVLFGILTTLQLAAMLHRHVARPKVESTERTGGRTRDAHPSSQDQERPTP